MLAAKVHFRSGSQGPWEESLLRSLSRWSRSIPVVLLGFRDYSGSMEGCPRVPGIWRCPTTHFRLLLRLGTKVQGFDSLYGSRFIVRSTDWLRQSDDSGLGSLQNIIPPQVLFFRSSKICSGCPGVRGSKSRILKRRTSAIILNCTLKCNWRQT